MSTFVGSMIPHSHKAILYQHVQCLLTCLYMVMPFIAQAWPETWLSFYCLLGKLQHAIAFSCISPSNLVSFLHLKVNGQGLSQWFPLFLAIRKTFLLYSHFNSYRILPHCTQNYLPYQRKSSVNIGEWETILADQLVRTNTVGFFLLFRRNIASFCSLPLPSQMTQGAQEQYKSLCFCFSQPCPELELDRKSVV